MIALLRSLLQLTKPSIMLLVLVTGATALVMEGSFVSKPLDFLLVMIGLFLTGGSANAINQYFEREIDAQMKRTAKRRPLPTGKLKPGHALAFALSIGIGGCLLFGLRFNWLSAAFAGGTIFFYGVIYTLLLKPNTAQNIVIGGAAGAMAPVIAWAAVTGGTALAPWLLFLIIFLWTPPHFWALALYLKDDYRTVKLPMMPVVAGDDATLKQIVWYTVATIATSIWLVVHCQYWVGAAAAIGLGLVFMKRALQAQREKTRAVERGLFAYSIIYLFALFFAFMVDGFIGIALA